MGLFTKKPAGGAGGTPQSSPPPPPSAAAPPPQAPKPAAEMPRPPSPTAGPPGAAPPPPPTHPKNVNVQMPQKPKEAAKPKSESDEKTKKLHELKGVIHRKLVDQLDMSKLGA